MIIIMKHATLSSPEGVWLVNKPVGQSSFKSVIQLRKITSIRKIGHTGTLDPLAEGLLVLLVGKDYTRKAQSLTKLDKCYELEITLGKFSSTDDNEGEKICVSDKRPSKSQLDAIIKSLTGEIMQNPPAYSAIKINGQRAYSLAREGKTPVIEPRKVVVYWWKDVEYEYPIIKAKVMVSSGTYIRSLARSIGEMLSTGAYLSRLKRTKVGDFSLDEAVSLEKLLDN